MKKFLAIILVLAIFLMQVPGIVFANDADVQNALLKLDSSDRNVLLSEIWDHAIVELNNSAATTANAIVTSISADIPVVWGKTVKTNTTPGDGFVSQSTVVAMVQVLLDNKSVISNLYDSFFMLAGDKASIKQKLSLPASASDYDVFNKLITTTGPLLTSSGNSFVAKTGIGAKLVTGLGISSQELQDAANVYVDSELARITTLFNNSYLNAHNVNFQNLIGVLTAYGIYSAPTVVSGGGGPSSDSATATPTATPTPTATATSSPVATPTPTSTSAPIATSSPLPQVVAEAVKIVENATALIAAEKDPEKALGEAVQLINNSVSEIKKLSDSGVSTKEVSQALENAANAVLDKVNTVSVNATVASGSSKAIIDTEASANLVKQLDSIAATVKELNTSLAQASTDAKIESVLDIKITITDKDIKVSSAQLPTSLLEAAATKKIDRILVDTGIAAISITPDAIKTSGSASVSLSAAKVDTSALSSAQKSVVGDNQVFEFKATAGDKAVTTFNKPVEITVPYTLKPGEDGNKLTVFFVNDKGALENVIGVYDPATKTVKFSTSHFSKYFVKENIVKYTDIESVKWAKDSIEIMASKGIINDAPGKFKPLAKLTRAQFTAVLIKAFKLEDSTAVNKFKDIKSTDSYYTAVISAAKAGIIGGKTPTTFAPNANITRQEAAVMVARVLRLVKGKTATADLAKYLAKFKDKNKISSVAKNDVALAVKYSTFCVNATDVVFNPQGTMTKAEMAVLMNRVFNVQ